MYNWFAQCQRLLTPARLALATAFTVAATHALLGAGRASGVLALCAVVCVAAKAYSGRVLGGVVGDFLGASIAVAETAIYLLLCVDWQVRACVALLFIASICPAKPTSAPCFLRLTPTSHADTQVACERVRGRCCVDARLIARVGCVQAAAQSGAAQKVALLAAVSALPVMYSRRIIDYNASC